MARSFCAESLLRCLHSAMRVNDGIGFWMGRPRCMNITAICRSPARIHFHHASRNLFERAVAMQNSFIDRFIDHQKPNGLFINLTFTSHSQIGVITCYFHGMFLCCGVLVGRLSKYLPAIPTIHCLGPFSRYIFNCIPSACYIDSGSSSVTTLSNFSIKCPITRESGKSNLEYRPVHAVPRNNEPLTACCRLPGMKKRQSELQSWRLVCAVQQRNRFATSVFSVKYWLPRACSAHNVCRTQTNRRTKIMYTFRRKCSMRLGFMHAV